MNTLFSPAELAIIVHYHAHCEDWDVCRFSSFGNAMPAFAQSTMDRLVELGLLVDHGFSAITGPRFTPTPRLRAYVEILCATPLPVQKWVKAEPDHPGFHYAEVEKMARESATNLVNALHPKNEAIPGCAIATCGTCGESIVPGLGRWVHLDTGDIRCHINTTSEAQPKDKSLYG